MPNHVSEQIEGEGRREQSTSPMKYIRYSDLYHAYLKDDSLIEIMSFPDYKRLVESKGIHVIQG